MTLHCDIMLGAIAFRLHPIRTCITRDNVGPMTTIRKVLIGMLAISTLLGVSAYAAAATGDLSAAGAATGSVAGTVDGSQQINTVHQTITDASHKLDGAVGSGVDASGSATGAIDAQGQHAGVSGTSSVSAKISGSFQGAMDKVRGLVDQIFGHVGGSASVNADASATGAANANQGGANAQGGFMAKLGAQLASLFHL